jgi:RHS repeat-associated protein
VTHLTKASTLIEKYKYDAFAAPTIFNGSGTQISVSAYKNRFLFTGSEPSEWGHREMDGQAREGSGRDERGRTSQYAPRFSIYEYRARAYNPTLRRFMSEDPKLFDAGLPAVASAQAGDYNLFRYVHNDPLDLTDPMGLFEVEFSDDYPVSAQGTVRTAVEVMASKPRGAQIKAKDPDRALTIIPTTGNQETGYLPGTNVIRLNPKDPLFLDPKSRKDFTKNPKELPPANDQGRAAILAHEFGHAVTRGLAGRDEIYGGRNVRMNENPVRAEQGIPPRETYGGKPLRGKIPGTAIERAIQGGGGPVQHIVPTAAELDSMLNNVGGLSGPGNGGVDSSTLLGLRPRARAP